MNLVKNGKILSVKQINRRTKEVAIKAVDMAGNSVENNVEMEIIPIPSPSITFVPNELFPEDGQDLTVRGTALPGINVLVQIQQILSQGAGEVVAKGVAQTDEKGSWEFTFVHQPIRNGKYTVSVQSQDARGALSLVVNSMQINVKSKPIIQFGALQLGTGGAALLLLLLLVAGFGGGAWFYKKRQEKLSMRVAFTETEITKMFKLVSQDVDALAQSPQTQVSGGEYTYALKKLQENIAKMEVYLKKGVQKIDS